MAFVDAGGRVARTPVVMAVAFAVAPVSRSIVFALAPVSRSIVFVERRSSWSRRLRAGSQGRGVPAGSHRGERFCGDFLIFEKDAFLKRWHAERGQENARDGNPVCILQQGGLMLFCK